MSRTPGSAFIGKGPLKISLYDPAVSFKEQDWYDAENASAFNISASEEEKTIMDFQNPGGGNDAAVKRITGISGAIDLRRFSAEVLALLAWGTTAPLDATPIPDEAGFVIVPGRFCPTDRIIDQSVDPVVKKGATVINPADYVVSSGGITIADAITTATVISGDTITISYTPLASDVVEALTTSGKTISIIIESVNEVNGKYSIGRYYKCVLGPLANHEWLGEDFGTFSASVTIVKDPRITAAGESQYYKVEVAK